MLHPTAYFKCIDQLMPSFLLHSLEIKADSLMTALPPLSIHTPRFYSWNWKSTCLVLLNHTTSQSLTEREIAVTLHTGLPMYQQCGEFNKSGCTENESRNEYDGQALQSPTTCAPSLCFANVLHLNVAVQSKHYYYVSVGKVGNLLQ